MNTNEATLRSLLACGYTPESAARAVQAADADGCWNWDLLEHYSGLTVRLRPPIPEN